MEGGRKRHAKSPLPQVLVSRYARGSIICRVVLEWRCTSEGMEVEVRWGERS